MPFLDGSFLTFTKNKVYSAVREDAGSTEVGNTRVCHIKSVNGWCWSYGWRSNYGEFAREKKGSCLVGMTGPIFSRGPANQLAKLEKNLYFGPLPYVLAER